MTDIRKTALRAAGLGAATAVAVGFFSAGAANADTFVPLPGGEIIETLPDGTVVTVRITDEWANITHGMSAQPLHRVTFVGGRATAEAKGDKAKVGIEPGYIVACQVNISSATTSGNSGLSGTFSNSGQQTAGTATVGGGVSMSIGAGQARTVKMLDLEKPDGYGNESHSGRYDLPKPKGAVNWSDISLEVNGCAGYAQARSYVRVRVDTSSTREWVTLWGQPFSLG